MSQTELAVCEILRKADVPAFTPYEVITERRTVSRRRGTTRLVEYPRPLFSRYLFADSDDVPGLRATRGVLGVVTGGDGTPLQVPVKGRFAELLDLAGSGKPLSRLDLTRLSLSFTGKVGDLFRFVDCPFEGQVGKITSVDQLDECGQIDAEVVIFGRPSTIMLRHQSVGEIVTGGDSLRIAAAARR